MQPAFAQLQEGDTARWQLATNLAMRLNRGNVERFIITPEADLAHLNKKRSLGLSARQRYTYGTFGDLTTERDLLSRNFVYAFPTLQTYPYIMAWFQTHELQRLQFRYQVGPGVTFVLLKSARHTLKFSFTGTYEENFYKEGNLSLFDPDIKRYDVIRVTPRVFGSHEVVPEIMFFNYELLFQQGLNNTDNWRIFFETSCTVRVINGFSLRTYLNYEYQQVYVATKKPEDLIFTVGLNYRTKTAH